MKKLTLTVLLAGTLSTGLFAQMLKNKKDGHYNFTIVKNLDRTDIDNQNRTGTCWSFSSLSFLESEMIRMGKPKVNLSEMYVVRKAYEDRADMFVRMQGNHQFGPGGEFHDMLNVYRKYGMMPQAVYGGLNYGEKKHVHNEMDEALSGFVKSIVKNPNGKISTAWKPALSGILDAYLGKVPESFEVEGKKFTPQAYAQTLGINPDDYVLITSFSHHPFYKKFVLEVADNWAMNEVYNLPVDEFASVISEAVNSGYTVAWSSDVSEKYFAWKNGVAIVPLKPWADMTKEEKDSAVNYPVAQMNITQQIRQDAFDNQETTDDHGMHIVGEVKDQNNTKYYIVKNSWGKEGNDCDGYIYASESYVLYKSTAIMVHKNAVPKAIAKKLGL